MRYRPKIKTEALRRVITYLTREQVDWLDHVGKDAYFSTGHKIHRTEVLAALVEFVRHLNFSGKGVRDSKHLVERLERIFKEQEQAVSHKRNQEEGNQEVPSSDE
jgi:hypothetical protein